MRPSKADSLTGSTGLEDLEVRLGGKMLDLASLTLINEPACLSSLPDEKGTGLLIVAWRLVERGAEGEGRKVKAEILSAEEAL